MGNSYTKKVFLILGNVNLQTKNYYPPPSDQRRMMDIKEYIRKKVAIEEWYREELHKVDDLLLSISRQYEERRRLLKRGRIPPKKGGNDD